jgi:mRNA interferase RelE/StbE
LIESNYKIIYKEVALKQLQKIEKSQQQRIVLATDLLSQNPRPPRVKKVQGYANLWRIRVGDFRVTYQIDEDVLTILVVYLGHRRDIYRKI